jgi:hypothetical protein
MSEHNCNEHDLFEHPEWLLEHYFNNSGIQLEERERNLLREHLKNRLGEQTAQAFLCPVNRSMTMEEYKCPPESFLEGKNYDHLLRHYAENGGAEKFAELREIRRKESEEKEKSLAK